MSRTKHKAKTLFFGEKCLEQSTHEYNRFLSARNDPKKSPLRAIKITGQSQTMAKAFHHVQRIKDNKEGNQ